MTMGLAALEEIVMGRGTSKRLPSHTVCVLQSTAPITHLEPGAQTAGGEEVEPLAQPRLWAAGEDKPPAQTHPPCL